MRWIKIDGEYYEVYSWIKPENSDVEVGETVFAAWPNDKQTYLATEYPNKLFHAIFTDKQPEGQPEYILKIPSTPDMFLLYSKIGDARPNPPTIKEYFSK